ncbi:MAG: malic enzyme-like NAD(P)-binding protein [Phycisphaerae bacterium]|nr:malic enzyme-like NAD(P)-binding protein [Phycisphaerae bacterium]
MLSQQAMQDRYQRNIVFGVRVALTDGEDAMAAILAAINAADARCGLITLAEERHGSVLHDLQIFTTGDEQMARTQKAIEDIEGVELIEVVDLAMELHRGGSTHVKSRVPIKSNTSLRIVYTPGVARVCLAIEAEPELAWEYTGIGNKIAIVTNGTAILGLGDIGCLAGLPVMEGKAAIFAEFAGISAEPVLIDTHDPDEFVHVMEKIACGYGAIQVEDVKAPECFKITRELDKRLKIPVLHDDQHGTASIVLAGLVSAIKKTGKKMEDMTTVISGAGAAGTAIADVLTAAGIPDVVLVDSVGIIHRGRTERMNAEKEALAERTNKENISGTLADAMKGRELFIGVSQPDIVTGDMVRSMAADPVLFPLANPVSEISKDDALDAGAAIYADGRMMNNAIAYPGLFRGAMEARAEKFTMEMLMAAAEALADMVPENELLPEMMDRNTHLGVATAVKKAAEIPNARPVQ